MEDTKSNAGMFNNMTLSEICELLMKFTHQYTRMMSENNRGNDFQACSEMILRLQDEIRIRQNGSEKEI